MGKKKGGAKAAPAAQLLGPSAAHLSGHAAAAFCSAFGPESAAASRTPHHVREGVSSSSASATSAYSDALLPDEDLESHFQEASSSALSEALYDEFSWRVRDISKVSEEYLYSEIFSIGGFKWRLLLYPRGNNNKYKALSVYLCVPDFQNLDPGWSRLAHFTLSVCNQLDPSKSHSCDGSNKFRKREHDWGFQSLMELSKLHEVGSGFIVDDSIVLQARVQVVTHVFMPMSLPYRRELLQRHFKCSLRFYFEEYLEEKVEEWEEFWLDNGTDFVGFWVGLSPAQRKALLQISRDTLLRRIRERLFSEKHVDCNLALDALYLAAEKLRETGFSTTAPLQLEAPPPSPAAGGPVAAASATAVSDSTAAISTAVSDPGALSVLVHAGGFVYMTETAEFPALLRDVRRDSLRLVKDCLSVKKASDTETDEIRLCKLEEIGCRVLHVFAMELVFHECVLSAFREKVARMRQEMLIMEEEEELRREEERKAAKKEKKKKKGKEKSSVSLEVPAVVEPAPLVVSAQADPGIGDVACDGDDEVIEVPPVDALSKNVTENASAKSSKRKAKDQPVSASTVSIPQLHVQTQAPLASGNIGTSATASILNDASSDYLSSSSTSSLKHDDAAMMALKQSTFQVLKESALSKPKNSGKKDASKAKSAVVPSKQQVPQPSDAKVEASTAISKASRARSPVLSSIQPVETVKLDPLEDPLRLASCAAFLAQPSYAAVFEKKALCFDISNAKCYRWLVPRRSLVLVVDRDAHLLRGVFETTGTVIIDPRKDVPSEMSAYVPISPLKSELFPPISLTRVSHLINSNLLSDESPFEMLTSSQFLAILQMLSTPAAALHPPQSRHAVDAKETLLAQNHSSAVKLASASLSSGVQHSNIPVRSSSVQPQDGYDSRDGFPLTSQHRNQVFASPLDPLQQVPVAQPSQLTSSTARTFYQPFASAGEAISGSGGHGFPRFQQTGSASVLQRAAPVFGAVAPTYPSSDQYGRYQAEQQQPLQEQQQPQQSMYNAGSWGGFSPWGGFDQSIVGSNESPEYLLGLVRQEFQQGGPESPPRDDGSAALAFPWNGPSPSSRYTAAPQPRSRLFGKAEVRDDQSNTLGLSAGMQNLDIHDHGGLGQTPWMPMEYNLPSGVGIDDFNSNSFIRSSQQHWQNSASELADAPNSQRGKAFRKH